MSRDELPAALAMWVGVSGFICGACRRTPEATLRKRIKAARGTAPIAVPANSGTGDGDGGGTGTTAYEVESALD